MRNWLFILPIAALISALTLPPARSGVRQAVGTLFVPISAPTRMVGSALRSRLDPPPNVDPVSPDHPRTLPELRRENELLRIQLLNMQAKLDDLAASNSQYAKLGELRKLVQTAMVIGGPTDQRQTISISTTGLNNVAVGMAVVSPFGYIGKIHSVSAVGGTARVLLATDPSSRLLAKFVRLVPHADGTFDVQPLDIPAPLVEGSQRQITGNTRQMVAGPLQPEPVKKLLKLGDVVVLDEASANFPPALRGLKLGTVSKIQLPPYQSGHAEVTIDPVVDYTTLREVQVVTKVR